MRAVAALCAGACAYLAAGLVTGAAPGLFRPRARRRRARTSQDWLSQAGVDLSPQQFWLGSAAVTLGALVTLSLVTGTPAVAAVPALTVGLLPRVYFARRRAVRMRAVTDAWPDGIRQLIAGIVSGQSLHAALVGLARTGPAPLRDAFARYEVRARMAGVVPALEMIREELAEPASDRVLEVLILAHERGGAVVTDILRDLAQAAAADAKAAAETQSASLEQRINARIVFALPWLVLVLLTARPGDFRDFYRTPAGLVVIAIGAFASVLGLVVVGRLSRDVAEQRVFGPSTEPEPLP